MKKILRLRLFTLILLVLAVIAVSYKYYLGTKKVVAYENATRAYEAQQYIKAEEYYQEALNNWSFDYQEKDMAKKYEALILSKNKLVTLMDQGEEQFADKEYRVLAETYQKIEALKKENEKNAIFQDYYAHLKIEEKYLQLFQKSKDKIIKKMETAEKNNAYTNEDDFFLLAEFPDTAYGNRANKLSQLTSLYKNYDKKKYSYLENQLSFSDIKNKIENQMSVYEKAGISQEWLNSKLNDLKTKNDQAIARMNEEQKKREEEFKKAQEEQQAQDPVMQEDVMTAVNEYAKSWIQAYNSLDSSYFVNITPQLQDFFDNRFVQIANNNAAFTGELLSLEYDLDSFTYENKEGAETVSVKVELTMNSASYTIGDEYELEVTSNPWLYTLIKDSNGQWLLDERKEIKTFNYENTRAFDMEYSY